MSRRHARASPKASAEPQETPSHAQRTVPAGQLPGQPELALDVTREAICIYCQLARHRPAVFAKPLARCEHLARAPEQDPDIIAARTLLRDLGHT